MSWMSKLCETYDRCAGTAEALSAHNPLLPIYHTMQQAHIEAVIDLDGNWIAGHGRVIEDKADQMTILPCTEASAGRTSGLAPHPLFDRLAYLAGDYLAFGGEEKKFGYEAYLAQLSDWCASPYGCEPVRAVYSYLQKGCLMQDLLRDRLLYQAPDDSVPATWSGDSKEKPPIFRACSDQMKALVRFRISGAREPEFWRDESVWQSWIAYQNSVHTDQTLCYATGELLIPSESSPKKIRSPADNAKLISANDASGFTYRGRFQDANEAFCVGRESTDKAHNALRWLIRRQGYRNDDQVVLAWMVRETQPPVPLLGMDTPNLTAALEEETEEIQEEVTVTGEDFAGRLRKAIAGYGCHLEHGEEAAVIGLDSATPGRLSIFYYSEMQAPDLLERVQRWHDTCTFRHTYASIPDGLDDKGKKKYRHVTFIGAPSPDDIAKAAYGEKADGKLIKDTVQRLLPCILEHAALPADLVRSAVRRASNPNAFPNDWEERKTRTIACALVRKYYNDQSNQNEEVWHVALDKQCNDRSYLFGRALAYARRLEELGQYVGGQARQTNAQRLQMVFSQHPAHTWKNLYHHLLPYLARLSGTRYERVLEEHERELDEVLGRIPTEEFNDKPLTPLYLLGYASQLDAIQKEIEEKKEEKKKNLPQE